MLRTMLKPRWLGLLGLLLVVLVLFTFLGLWQLSVAKDEARRTAVEEAPRQPVAALTDVLQPHAEFPATASGRRVSATGHYDPTGQVLVTDRRLDGATGSWVITPLVVDATGARIAVLRGFVRGLAAPPPTTSATTTVVGSVAPGESPATGTTPLPSGQLGAVDLGKLVNLWPGEIYNAFLFGISETPDATAAGPAGASVTPGVLERVPPPPVPSGLNLRNAAYALQWWVFGLFAAYLWWRMVRDDYQQDEGVRRRRDGPRPDDPLPDDPGPPAPHPHPTSAGATRS
ncbi:MAG: SURF1 family protein [Lapillicoccus sp.]